MVLGPAWFLRLLPHIERSCLVVPCRSQTAWTKLKLYEMPKLPNLISTKTYPSTIPQYGPQRKQGTCSLYKMHAFCKLLLWKRNGLLQNGMSQPDPPFNIGFLFWKTKHKNREVNLTHFVGELSRGYVCNVCNLCRPCPIVPSFPKTK